MRDCNGDLRVNNDGLSVVPICGLSWLILKCVVV